MPKGTKVESIYQALLDKGYDKGKAARIAQAKAKQSLATGRPTTESCDDCAVQVRKNVDETNRLYGRKK